MKKRLFYLLGGIVVTIVVAGCGSSETTAPTAPAESAAVSEAPVAVAMAAPDEGEVVMVVDDSPQPMLPVYTPPVDESCLNCHTNVELLRELGEEEATVKLSEGKG